MEETNEAFRQGLLENHPTMTESCFVCSDTVGTIATAFEDGGWGYRVWLGRVESRRLAGGIGGGAVPEVPTHSSQECVYLVC